MNQGPEGVVLGLSLPHSLLLLCSIINQEYSPHREVHLLPAKIQLLCPLLPTHWGLASVVRAVPAGAASVLCNICVSLSRWSYSYDTYSLGTLLSKSMSATRTNSLSSHIHLQPGSC